MSAFFLSGSRKAGAPPMSAQEALIERSPQPLMTAKEAQKIIDDYGALTKRNPPSALRIEDVAKLPHPKETILTAVCLALVQRGVDQNFATALKYGAIGLAQYQSGVGEEPLHFFGFDHRKERDVPPKDAMKGKTRFKEFKAVVEKDVERIKKILVQVEALQKRRNQGAKRSPTSTSAAARNSS